MSKYQRLTEYLKGVDQAEVNMTFAAIEAVLGTKLPRSAYEHQAWWANEEGGSHVQAKSWLGAGYGVRHLNRKTETVMFVRQASFAEGARDYKMDSTPRRHPAFGALKGTFTIEPGTDLTSPAIPPEEWAEIEDEIVAKFDRLLGK